MMGSMVLGWGSEDRDTLPELPRPTGAYPFHRNIRIEDNDFPLFDFPVLYA